MDHFSKQSDTPTAVCSLFSFQLSKDNRINWTIMALTFPIGISLFKFSDFAGKKIVSKMRFWVASTEQISRIQELAEEICSKKLSNSDHHEEKLFIKEANLMSMQGCKHSSVDWHM